MIEIIKKFDYEIEDKYGDIVHVSARIEKVDN